MRRHRAVDNAPAHRQNRLPDGRPPVRALAHLAKILSLECFKGSKNAPRALLSDKACFRDRYFEILAYLLTVLAETLRSSAMVLCGYPAAFMLWMASQSSQLVRLVGVVCGRGRNPTLRLWPTIFSGKIDVFPGDRRSRLISSMTSVAPA